MTGDALGGQTGVELRVIGVGPHVMRTFGISDLCVRASERSHGLAGRMLAEVTGLATAQDTNALMVKATARQAWPDGDVDLLGHLF